MKICTCNNCGTVYEDMNAQTDAKEYTYIEVPKLVRLSDDDSDKNDVQNEYWYWGCPKCETDAYLQDDINWGSLIRIDALILKKKLGEDCTEDDSAWIKGWLRETLLSVEDGTYDTYEEIQTLFPVEYGEHLDEEKGEWEPPYPETKVFRAMEGGTDGG